METKRLANPVMEMQVMDVVLTLAYNIVIMTMNAFSSFISLQHPDAFFTEVATRQELRPMLGPPLKLRSAQRMLQLQSPQHFHLQEVQQLTVLPSLPQFNLLEVLRSPQRMFLLSLHPLSPLHNRQSLPQVNLQSLHHQNPLEVRPNPQQVDLQSLHQLNQLKVHQSLQQVALPSFHQLNQLEVHPRLQPAVLQSRHQLNLPVVHHHQSQHKHPQWLMAST